MTTPARKPSKPWRVYGTTPPPVTVPSERAARRLARRYGRLGISATLYERECDQDWERRGIISPQQGFLRRLAGALANEGSD